MPSDQHDAPSPDLRIVPTGSLQPHEEHDSQRAQPLIERLKHEQFVINPPIVTQMDDNRYVILDGANRYYAFSHLGYPHILVQVTSYESGYVELKTWRHIVSHWHVPAFLGELGKLGDIELVEGQDHEAIAHIFLRDGRLMAVRAAVETTHERNAALRDVVRLYQQNATLHRTALSEPDEIWPLYPEAIAVVVFPHCRPADVMAAARHQAFLPPGISRHILHGRALRVNYPLEALRSAAVSLDEKNAELRVWVQNRLARRQIRYYAEATYQFDE